MSTAELLTLIQNSAIAQAVSKSNHLVGAALQVVHVLGFIMLLAALVLMSLRLTGLSLANYPVQDLIRDARKLARIGLTLAISSGVLMFIATPKLYFYKPMFQLKMLLFVAALVLQFTVLRWLLTRDSTSTFVARTTVAISLFAWFGIGFAGRMIGFT
jgi:hypothetical protein